MSCRRLLVVTLLLAACESQAPKETAATSSASATATVTATATASSSAAPAPSASAHPACPEPWVLLELLPPGKRAGAEKARKVVAGDPELQPCEGDAPRAGGEICLLYVHFYGTKHFAPENLHRNRDAIAARCFHPDDCRRLAEGYGKSDAETTCQGTIPTSGSIERL